MKEYTEIWAKAVKCSGVTIVVPEMVDFGTKKIFKGRQKQALYNARDYREQSKSLNIRDYFKDQQNSFLKTSKRHLREY